MTWLLILLIVLSIADIVTTVIGVKLGASEGNPVARYFLGLKFSIPRMILLKAALCAILGLLLVYYPSWWPLIALNCAFSVYVVWNNVQVIRELR